MARMSDSEESKQERAAISHRVEEIRVELRKIKDDPTQAARVSVLINEMIAAAGRFLEILKNDRRSLS